MIATQADVENITLTLSSLRICAVLVEVASIAKAKRLSAVTLTTDSVTRLEINATGTEKIQAPVECGILKTLLLPKCAVLAREAVLMLSWEEGIALETAVIGTTDSQTHAEATIPLLLRLLRDAVPVMVVLDLLHSTRSAGTLTTEKEM